MGEGTRCGRSLPSFNVVEPNLGLMLPTMVGGMTTYPAASIANAFLDRASASGETISPMKMQKLIYIAHGYGLVECEEPIINEVFEAWKFGPVLNSVYHECKHYGKSAISQHLRDWDYQTGERKRVPTVIDPRINDIIDYVWSEYGEDTALSLSDWTHAKGGPWDHVTQGGNRILRNQDIPNDLIRDYFKQNLYSE